MNNKGQVLVFFVILIPLIALLFAFIFDTSNILYEKIKLNSIASTAYEYMIENKSNEIIKEYIKNNDNLVEIKINTNYLKLTKNFRPYFSNMLKLKNYKIEIIKKG